MREFTEPAADVVTRLEKRIKELEYFNQRHVEAAKYAGRRIEKLTEWRPIADAPDEQILAAHEEYAGGCQMVVERVEEAERTVQRYWEGEEGTLFHRDRFTHWKPLGKGPGDE